MAFRSPSFEASGRGCVEKTPPALNLEGHTFSENDLQAFSVVHVGREVENRPCHPPHQLTQISGLPKPKTLNGPGFAIYIINNAGDIHDFYDVEEEKIGEGSFGRVVKRGARRVTARALVA